MFQVFKFIHPSASQLTSTWTPSSSSLVHSWYNLSVLIVKSHQGLSSFFGNVIHYLQISGKTTGPLFNVLLVSPFIILLLVYLSKWSNPWVNKLCFNLSNIPSFPDVAQDTWTSSNYTFCMAIFSINYPTFRGSIQPWL